MPHLILEFSDNVPDSVDGPKVLRALHESLVGSGPFAMNSIKSRAVRYGSFCVGNGASNNAFVHLTLAILPGRDQQTKQKAAQTLMSTLLAHFPRTSESPHSITCEVRELDGPSYQKQSNLT